MDVCGQILILMTHNFEYNSPYVECRGPALDTPYLLLEQRMEAAGQRIAAYLRHLPMPERKRHTLALQILDELAKNPGDNPAQAQARGMAILRDLMQDERPILHVYPGPKLMRKPMVPEEMDRRPWVGAFFRVWRPLWLMAANFSNLFYLHLLQYTLLLAGMYALEKTIPWTILFFWHGLMDLIGKGL
ncbi:MAG: hypothetical protein GX043_07810 [Desulfovibrionales bacterium]|nr:hypothetical protein [Desulfovibrionales bacterium]